MKSALRGASPSRCDERELAEFERLVRAGFAGSDETLPQRIRAAHSLAFYVRGDVTIAGIAALKGPDDIRRQDCFQRARAESEATAFPLELGWVYVEPEHRGSGIGERLCRLLLARAPRAGVFATTTPDNAPMLRILRDLGFLRAGTAHARSRRGEDLQLHVLRDPGATR